MTPDQVALHERLLHLVLADVSWAPGSTAHTRARALLDHIGAPSARVPRDTFLDVLAQAVARLAPDAATAALARLDTCCE